MAIDRIPVDDRQCVAVLRCAICGKNATPWHKHSHNEHDENAKGKIINANNKYTDVKVSNTLEPSTAKTVTQNIK